MIYATIDKREERVLSYGQRKDFYYSYLAVSGSMVELGVPFNTITSYVYIGGSGLFEWSQN